MHRIALASLALLAPALVALPASAAGETCDGRDHLDLGRGRDRADGGVGMDACLNAERAKGCEVRR